MARMRFKNSYNYDSATRQLSTRDMDWILDTDTDVGYAFSLVVAAAIDAGLVDFSENFISENDLLETATADTLYEVIGAVAAHLAELDPHPQYTTASELATALADYVTTTSLGTTLSDYSTTAVADTLYDAIGEAAAEVAAHLLASDPHPEYTTAAELATALSDYLTTAAAASTYATAGHTHGAAGSTRTTVTITTASIDTDTGESGSFTMAPGYRLLKIDVDRSCRVRIYTTSAKRDADVARAIGTDVDIATDHGLVFEYVAEAAIAADLSPAVDGWSPANDSTVYYRIRNRSGGTSTVEVTFTWIRTE